MKLEWAAICQRGIIDSRNGLATLLDVVMHFHFRYSGEKPPSHLPGQLTLATGWRRSSPSETKAQVRIEVYTGRQRVHEGFVEIPFSDESQTHINFYSISPIPLEHRSLNFVISTLDSSGTWRRAKSVQVPISLTRVPEPPTNAPLV